MSYVWLLRSAGFCGASVMTWSVESWDGAIADLVGDHHLADESTKVRFIVIPDIGVQPDDEPVDKVGRKHDSFIDNSGDKKGNRRESLAHTDSM